jgi:flagellar biosynthesis/type III secretory pathway protein FliH
MSDLRTPFNRPTVLTLARVDSQRRVIPAEHVQQIEEVAAGATSAGRRIQQAEVAFRQGLDGRIHAAWQRGFSSGHAEALEKLSGFLGELDALRGSIDAELVGLVIEAVARIVKNLPVGLVTTSLVEAALNEAQGEHARLTLRVHASRVTLAEKTLREADGTSRGLRVTVEADATLDPDDCLLDTPAGTIDTSLQTQLEALAAALRGHA